MIELVNDPDTPYSEEGRAKQREINLELYNMTNQLGYVYYSLEKIHNEIQALTDKQELENQEELSHFAEEVEGYKNSLVSLGVDFYVDEGEANIREDISNLALNVSQYPGMPSEGQIRKTAELSERMGKVMKQFNTYKEKLTEINGLLATSGHPMIEVGTLEEYLED